MLFELCRMLFVGPLHLSLQLVVGMVDGPLVAHEGFGLFYTLEHLFVFPDDLVAADQPQFVLLQLLGGYGVSEVSDSRGGRGSEDSLIAAVVTMAILD